MKTEGEKKDTFKLKIWIWLVRIPLARQISQAILDQIKKKSGMTLIKQIVTYFEHYMQKDNGL